MRWSLVRLWRVFLFVSLLTIWLVVSTLDGQHTAAPASERVLQLGPVIAAGYDAQPHWGDCIYVNAPFSSSVLDQFVDAITNSNSHMAKYESTKKWSLSNTLNALCVAEVCSWAGMSPDFLLCKVATATANAEITSLLDLTQFHFLPQHAAELAYVVGPVDCSALFARYGGALPE